MSESNNNITQEVLELAKEQDKKLTKEEIEENVIEWCTFYRRNLDVFNEDYLGIKVNATQKIMINTMSDNDISDIICSRGGAKSFDVGLTAIDFALLYSNCRILIVSMTINQSNLIIDEKIDKIFCTKGTRWSSDILCKLRDEGWIQFKTNSNTNARFVEFGNGSKIFAVCAGESTRGERSNITITDEFMLVKKKDYDEIIEPTLRVRDFKGRPADYDEEPKQIFLSSARTKTNWGWTHLRNCVEQHYKSKTSKYGFFLVDIFTSVLTGILTKKQYIQRKKNTDDMSFQQEYLNIFLGNGEDSIFKYEDFEQNQNIEDAFYPRTKQDIIEVKEQKYKFRDNDIRFLVSDIAVATGDDNDNTVFLLGKLNKNTKKLSLEYIDTKSGLNSLQQVVLMKRYFYEYRCSYFVVDTKGVGNVIFDILTTPTFDEEFGITYPAWTANTDKELQISSDTVINDKIVRTMSNDAKDVIIPFAGTAELNSMMHLTTRKALKDGTVSLLIDDYDKKANLEDKDPTFIMKSAEEKADILIPYVQTRYMINEAVALEVKFTDTGLIKVQEAKRTATKDRYMTFGMFCLFGDKLVNKYCKQGNDDDDIDWDEISLVY
jgi:hypothetical protein